MGVISRLVSRFREKALLTSPVVMKVFTEANCAVINNDISEPLIELAKKLDYDHGKMMLVGSVLDSICSSSNVACLDLEDDSLYIKANEDLSIFSANNNIVRMYNKHIVYNEIYRNVVYGRYEYDENDNVVISDSSDIFGTLKGDIPMFIADKNLKCTEYVILYFRLSDNTIKKNQELYKKIQESKDGSVPDYSDAINYQSMRERDDILIPVNVINGPGNSVQFFLDENLKKHVVGGITESSLIVPVIFKFEEIKGMSFKDASEHLSSTEYKDMKSRIVELSEVL